MDKVRLVKGPFGGKVIDHPHPGANEIIVTGPKKMTRRKRYELMSNANIYGPYTSSRLDVQPTARAIYRIAMRRMVLEGHSVNVPLYHPDGSLFYEFTGKEL